MAVISADTFNALTQYVAVRLQQGVPLVDADWNAMEDTRRYEVRAFLKWFVGDGVPEGNDGFRIVGQGVANDFLISRGYTGTVDAVRNLGRCVVDGFDVIIENDVTFRNQPLHVSQAGSAALATRLGVPTIPELAVLDGTIVAYLDVWERLVTPNEDPALVATGLGTESCARLRRERVVRTRVGTTVPAPGDADFIAAHSYYALATIARRTASPLVDAADVTDRRERRLLMPPATLITDLFGTSPGDYRRGSGRPVINLREAINSLLRGELPGTVDAPISPSTGSDLHRRGFFLDVTGGLVAVWQSNRVATQDHVFASRLSLTNVPGGFSTPPQQLTTGATGFTEPHAVGLPLPTRDVLAVYTRGAGANADIVYRRVPPTGPLGAETDVSATAAVAERSPFTVLSGILAVIIWHNAGTNLWQYRRYRHTDDTFIDATAQQFSATTTTQRDLHAAVDSAGNVWAAFRAGNDIRAMEFTPATGAVANEITRDSGAGVDEQPFVLCRSNGEIWVFWRAPDALHLATFIGGVWSAVQTIPNTIALDRQPSAVEESDGGIWLFWTRGPLGSGDLFFQRRNPTTGNWGQPRQMTLSLGDDAGPFALIEPGTNAIWVFWTSDRSGDIDIYFKRLVTAI